MPASAVARTCRRQVAGAGDTTRTGQRRRRVRRAPRRAAPRRSRATVPTSSGGSSASASASIRSSGSPANSAADTRSWARSAPCQPCAASVSSTSSSSDSARATSPRRQARWNASAGHRHRGLPGHRGQRLDDRRRRRQLAGLQVEAGQEHRVVVGAAAAAQVPAIAAPPVLQRADRGVEIALVHREPGPALEVRGDGGRLVAGPLGVDAHPFELLRVLGQRVRRLRLGEVVERPRGEQPFAALLRLVHEAGEDLAARLGTVAPCSVSVAPFSTSAVSRISGRSNCSASASARSAQIDRLGVVVLQHRGLRHRGHRPGLVGAGRQLGDQRLDVAGRAGPSRRSRRPPRPAGPARTAPSARSVGPAELASQRRACAVASSTSPASHAARAA